MSALEDILNGVDDGDEELVDEPLPVEATSEDKDKEQETSPLAAASTYELVRNLYKDDFNRPFSMTPGQNEIFDLIFKKGCEGETLSQDGMSKVKRWFRRIWIATFTQFGKSDTVSMAVLTRVATFPEKWCIVAPSQAKAKIIMGYLIKHIFDNEYTMARFKIEEGENADSIRRERSKNRLTFDLGDGGIGEVFILSAESRLKNGEDAGNAMMGFGAPNVVMDEAALISDESDAKAMRMVGGFTGGGMDFVVKIGNPFVRGHFLKAYEDPAYYKINIDYTRGLKEVNEYGETRLTSEFITEMKLKPFFRVLYENLFPVDGDIDSKGWTQILGESDIDRACMVPEGSARPEHAGEKRIGNDIARGGANYTVWCLRSMNYAEILAKSHQNNLTEIASQTSFFLSDTGVKDENCFIDDVGVGGGAVDPLLAEQRKVRGVNVGQAALEDTKFANMRAEAYWRLREWVTKGGKLCPCHRDDWMQLTKVKYKPDSKGRLRVMSKDDMRAIGIESPDVADALMLTFVRREHADLTARKKARDAKKKKRVTGRGYSVSMGGY
jgi:hypothetical protein